MLEITIDPMELYDEKSQSFIMTKQTVLQLEHSLLSLSKWESKWKKSFLESDKTLEETIDYVKCMTINKNVDDMVYRLIPESKVNEIMDYIQDPHTATTFPNTRPGKKGHDVVTAELIYYWMIAQNIPIEFQKWHLNRLMTLIRVCGLKNSPDANKKMSKRDIMRQNSALNAARRAKTGSKG